MKKLIVFVCALLFLSACEKKQYFTTCPEIDLIHKGNEAYFKGDWETFKSVFSDDAKIYDNDYDSTKVLSPDQLIERYKSVLSNYAEYKRSDFYVNEMIITDNGDKWVHSWFVWSGKTKDGKDASTPVNISFLVKDNKVMLQSIIYNALPGYLAVQPSDSTQVNP